MLMSKKISKLIILSAIVLTILALISNLNLIIESTEHQAKAEIMAPDPTLKITAKTDKETYLLRQNVTIDGNITQDGSPATDLVVIMQAEDPLNTSIAFRTLTIGNPTQTWPLNITNLFLMDILNNPINTVKIGTEFQAKITIQNWQMTAREFYATVTVFDANMVPIRSAFTSGTISPLETISPRFTIYLEKWACSGKALIVGNVYSKEPKTTGIALSLEKTAYFCISKVQQGLFEYPELPPPPPQTTPGFFSTNIRLSPEPRAGQYKLNFTSQASPTATSTTTATFNVQDSTGYPPQASFAYWPAMPYRTMTVNFDASSSTAEGFNDVITKYEWNFGDGTPKVTKTTPTTTHAYQLTGTFIVTLNVTDSEGLWSTTSKPITIYQAPPPKANFTWSPQAPYINQTVNFDASSSTTEAFKTIIQYVWDFGDGTPKVTKTSPTTTYAYQLTGTFIVTLNVTDSEGLWNTTSKPITINPEFGPTANFTYIPDIVLLNQTVTFDASNSKPGWSKIMGAFSPIVSYAWNFSDGTDNITQTTPIIYHNFTLSGNFTVTLTVADSVNRKASVSDIVEVLNQTVKDYDFDGNGKIDMKDVRRVAKAFGSYPGHPFWDPVVDTNHDDKIDMKDIRPVAKNFGKDP